jgi:hypothetical protein
MSKKRQHESKKYLRLKSIFLENHPACEFRGLWTGNSYSHWQRCTQRATEIHQKNGPTDKNYLDTETWMAVCAEHHCYIHDNPKWELPSG